MWSRLSLHKKISWNFFMSNRILSDDEDSLFGKSDDEKVAEPVEEPTVEDLFGEESEGEEPIEQKQEEVVLDVNLPDLGGPKTNPDVYSIDVAFPAEITHVFEY
jgi:hypothetical protein